MNLAEAPRLMLTMQDRQSIPSTLSQTSWKMEEAYMVNKHTHTHLHSHKHTHTSCRKYHRSVCQKNVVPSGETCTKIETLFYCLISIAI